MTGVQVFRGRLPGSLVTGNGHPHNKIWNLWHAQIKIKCGNEKSTWFVKKSVMLEYINNRKWTSSESQPLALNWERVWTARWRRNKSVFSSRISTSARWWKINPCSWMLFLVKKCVFQPAMQKTDNDYLIFLVLQAELLIFVCRKIVAVKTEI